MKPQINKTGALYALLCPLLALAGAVYNFFLLKYASDKTTVTEQHESVLYRSGTAKTVFVVFAVLAAVALFSAIIVFRKSSFREAAGGWRAARFFFIAASGVTLVFLIPLQFILNTAGTQYELNNEAFSIQNSSSAQKICLALALFAAAYFLLQLFTEKKTRTLRIVRTLLGMTLVFFFCGQLLVTHNYMNDFLGSPTRVLGLTSFCFLIFFILSELRTGLPGRSMPGAYAATGMLALFFTAIECLPLLLLSFMNTAGYKNNISVFYLLLKLFVGIYAYISVCPTLLGVCGGQRVDASGENLEETTADDLPPENDLPPEDNQPSGDELQAGSGLPAEASAEAGETAEADSAGDSGDAGDGE